MYVDFKVTTWERVHIHEDDFGLVLTKLKSKEIETSSQLIEEFPNSEFEQLYDVDEQMTPEDNNGYATIEAYENQELIFKDSAYE